MNKVEIAFSRGLRMDLKSKDIVLVVSTQKAQDGRAANQQGLSRLVAGPKPSDTNNVEMGALRGSDGKTLTSRAAVKPAAMRPFGKGLDGCA